MSFSGMGKGGVRGEMSSGHLGRAEGCSRRCGAACQAQCGAVRTERSEPRAWRHLLSHLLDFLLVTASQAPSSLYA